MDWVPAPITTEFSTHPMVIFVPLMSLARVRNLPNPVQATNIKKTLSKDFTSQESDIERLQKLIDSGKMSTDQRQVWENIGLALGTIIENEMDGMEWGTVVEGRKEYPALCFKGSSLLIQPSFLILDKVKQKQPIHLKHEFDRIKQQVEEYLNKK